MRLGLGLGLTTNRPTPDITAPTLSGASGIPVTDTRAVLAVTTNEGTGMIYWAILPSADAAPSAASLIAGTTGGVASGSFAPTSGINTLSTAALTVSTGYKVHFVHRDLAANTSAVASSATFTQPSAASQVFRNLLAWRQSTGLYDRVSGISQAGVVRFGGNNYAVDGAVTWVDSMTHSLQISGKNTRVRLGVKNTDNDRASGDNTQVRRSELDSRTTLVAGTAYWGAKSFLIEPWDTETTNGMASLGATQGMAFVQWHPGSGSPAFAIRLNGAGKLWITRTTGSLTNETLYTAPAALSQGGPHDVVYQVTQHPTLGFIKVWLDGVLVYDSAVLNPSGFAVGINTACDEKCGIYASGGIGTVATYPNAQVYIQIANDTIAQTGTLASRVTSAPAWPTDALDNTNAPTVTARLASAVTGNSNTITPTLATHAAGDYLAVLVGVDDIDTPATTATAGWVRAGLIAHSTAGRNHVALFVYGTSNGDGTYTAVAAPSSATTAPAITISFEQAEALAFTISSPSGAPRVEFAGSVINGATLHIPPTLTLAGGADRSALFIGFVSLDMNTLVANAITNGPAGYNPLTNVEASSSGNVSVTAAETRLKVASESPGGFTSGATAKDGVTGTVAFSLAA